MEKLSLQQAIEMFVEPDIPTIKLELRKLLDTMV
jgi:hypothetical protein